MDEIKNFVAEIHRRSLWKVMGIYLGASWVVLEVVDGIAEAAGLPDWLPSFALILLVVGLPIVLATAFVQVRGDDTPEVGPVESSPSPGLAVGTGSLDRPSTRPPLIYRLLTWRRAITGGVLAFALWGAAVAGWLLIKRSLPPLPDALVAATAFGDTNRRSVAVLPFALRGTGADNEAAFADGIHDDILTQLSKIAALKVISRTSVMAYRDPQRNLKEIGAALGVAAVLEGGIQWDGNRVRINLQLIDATTDEHLWAETYVRELLDIFEVQADIASRVADALQAVVTPDEARRIAIRGTDNEAAYELYLQNTALSDVNEEENEAAVALLRRALELDPDYALAHAQLGQRYRVRVLRFGHPREWSDSAVAQAQRATELDRDLPYGHLVRGVAHFDLRQTGAAEAALLQALELDPNNGSAMRILSANYLLAGEADTGLYWATRSTIQDPLGSNAHLYVAFAEIFLDRPQRALAALERGELDPTPDVDWLEFRPATALFAGNVELAQQYFDEVSATRPASPALQAVQVHLLLAQGRFDEAVAVGSSLVRQHPSGFHSAFGPYALILGAALLEAGEVDAARDAVAPLLPVLANLTSPQQIYQLALAHLISGDHESAISALRRAQLAGLHLSLLIRRPASQWRAVIDDPEVQAILADMDREVEIVRRRADARVAELVR